MTNPQSNPLGPEGSYFESKKQQQQNRQHKQLANIFPLFITGLYLMLGFSFRLWHPGWLLFLTIPLFYMHPKTTLQKLSNPVMITLIYLVLGFFFRLWHPGWLIFLVIPAAAILDNSSPE